MTTIVQTELYDDLVRVTRHDLLDDAPPELIAEYRHVQYPRPSAREPLEGVPLGYWQMFVLHHPDSDVNPLAPWFYRFEPIGDET